MKITLNNVPLEISDSALTMLNLLESQKIAQNGTAIALNGKLLPRKKWNEYVLRENDDIVIISAAFGG